MKNTVFTKELSICNGKEDFNKVWATGEGIFKAALNEEYKNVPEVQIFSILKNNISKTNEYGLIDICPGVPTDREARVFMWYMPTYANLAALVYLKLNSPEKFDEKFDNDFMKMMDVAFEYGIVGHGFDAPKMARETMLMFARAGARTFIEMYPEFSKQFTKIMNGYISRYKTILENEGTEQGIYKDNVFNPEPENHLLRELLDAWSVEVEETEKEIKEMSSMKIEVEKQERAVLNTTIRKGVLDEFKVYCKAAGIPMNIVLEAFMRQFVDGEYILKIAKENVLAVELED